MSIGERISLEGNVDGKLHRELEYTFYGQVTSLADLERAPVKEEHEQWVIPIDSDSDAVEARVRIRSINARQWVLTTKIRRPGVLGWEEVDQDISQDTFNHLRQMGINGFKKTRYLFKVPNTTLNWEVDVFTDVNGQKHPWVKLDLEVENADIDISQYPLPVPFKSIITNQSRQQTEEEKNWIDRLWKSQWIGLDHAQRTR